MATEGNDRRAGEPAMAPACVARTDDRVCGTCREPWTKHHVCPEEARPDTALQEALSVANECLDLMSVPEHMQDDEWYRREKAAYEAVAKLETAARTQHDSQLNSDNSERKNK